MRRGNARPAASAQGEACAGGRAGGVHCGEDPPKPGDGSASLTCYTRREVTDTPWAHLPSSPPGTSAPTPVL